MFTTFRGIYTWESQHESMILCHFNHEASEWLKKHLYLARTLYKAPLEWMTPSVWESLQKYWGSEEFKKISEQNKKNRAVNGSSSIVIYRGGSVSTAIHRLRLIEELGREPTPKECFIRTHGKKDGTLEGERATQIVEQFDKALADKRDQGEDENSINQNELWDRIAIGSRNRVLGKGNISRQMSSINYKPRSGPSQSSGQLYDQINELQAELAKTQAKHNAMLAEHDTMRAEHDAMRIEWARRESFEMSLLAALRLKGIDLSDMHVATLTRSIPRAPTVEAQSHVDEHSPTRKRPRTTLVADNTLDGLNDKEDIC
ncbi:uncharacterized protein LOC120274079 isoform X1 [Dioscorea cayenensis subsp. rotundata]|uniref:Uncharacterized protein LOC120274079 isoform X1 n=1 Tax=Dioscorea cayennensis subsp. rotundata TaxID=55577 RepID=A0AB40CAB1_DIOCR|nr:uncharacterized protein LOC120274079 isoform X1 [Dioscorea cayenensis subsp. rotundata]